MQIDANIEAKTETRLNKLSFTGAIRVDSRCCQQRMNNDESGNLGAIVNIQKEYLDHSVRMCMLEVMILWTLWCRMQTVIFNIKNWNQTHTINFAVSCIWYLLICLFVFPSAEKDHTVSFTFTFRKTFFRKSNHFVYFSYFRKCTTLVFGNIRSFQTFSVQEIIILSN